MWRFQAIAFQAIEELSQRYRIPPSKSGSSSAQGGEFGWGGRYGGIAFVEIGAKRFAHQFRPGARLFLSYFFELPYHGGRERDAHDLGGSRGGFGITVILFS